MARINIEDHWWTDPRRDALIALVGPIADAVAVRMWRLAQTYFRNRRNVPVPIYESALHWREFEQVGLADRSGDFVYIRGQGDAFSWIDRKRAAGRMGGLAASKPSIENKEENKQQKTAHDSKRQQTQASLSLSLSRSSSKESPTGIEKQNAVANAPASPPAKTGKRGFTEEQREKARAFCAAYVKAYQTRFPGQRPDDLWDKATQGQILHMVGGGFPVPRLCELIQAYFQIDDKWFGKRGYGFATFRANLNVIGQALAFGADPSGIDWSKVFPGGAA